MKHLKDYHLRTYTLLILAILAGSLTQLQAQHKALKGAVKLDTASMRIGEQTDLVISLADQSPDSIIWPEYKEQLLAEGVEVVKSAAATLKDGYLEKRYTITSFDSGLHFIDTMQLLIGLADEQRIDTGILPVNLALNVLTVELDGTDSIKPLASIAPVPYVWDDFSVWVYLLLGLVVIGLTIWYLWRKYKKNKEEIELGRGGEAKIPEDEVALNALSQMKATKIWDKVDNKTFYIDLTLIIRNYVERRFGIEALELTSGEMLDQLRTARVDKKDLGALRELLSFADFVKFAKGKSTPTESLESVEQAIFFVEQTKREEMPLKEYLEGADNTK